MNKRDPNRDLARRIAATLDAACRHTDARDTQRLDQARRAALGQTPSTRPGRWLGPTLAAASVAIVALAAVLIQPREPATAPVTADLDLLTRPEFELFLEDPEFFAWVAAANADRRRNDDAGEGSSG